VKVMAMRRSSADLGFIHRFKPGKGNLTLLLLHGTGGDEEDLLALGTALAPDASLLSPRGKVTENGMPRFFRRLAEGVFDLEDLKFRSEELADFVKAASVRYDFESKPVVLVGYSNGANIAAGMLRPEELPDLKGMPVFISAGRFDQVVPPGEAERLARLLGDAGAEVTLNWENGTHALAGQGEVKKAASWLLQNFGS